MARNKEFDIDHVLDAAIDVFRSHGYAGTSAGMLVEAMRIGRQSLYDTFGDKWGLYCAAVKRYGDIERQAHLDALNEGHKAIDGLRAMMNRVVREARQSCLGVVSICEFGDSDPELTKLREGVGKFLLESLTQKVREAQAQGDISRDVDAKQAASFLFASIAAIRLSARGGATDPELASLGQLAMRVLM
ncbi:TetR/AcrR family transcriptional regulator [Burkholderia sp. AU42008]|uniref:TetR/AcrR family transcriptional regulator n=1 Tax=unclassified Burkholderia TaxID=2613784 RepID=UPI000B7A325C|nr:MULTISPECIES: TetR/AcrR family transcriptional regulator [unclassified Burkholderia]MBR8236030.1 TetR/AcrR family transcriptional regulator [Burkholderia sp. AU32357]MBY4871786.1 TetR/AcrR family transcriptional regulator [Burkholderia sp. AU42008]OXI37874.1 TetR family transcriptional regulator [Burkholderia sp. AU17457]